MLIKEDSAYKSDDSKEVAMHPQSILSMKSLNRSRNLKELNTQ